MNKHFDISIILPVFNEGENITKQIFALEKDLKNPHEILIVYDFNEDNTIPFAQKLCKKYKTVQLVKNIFGRGVINAVKTGIKNAKGEVVVIMPADLADDPNTINRMFEKIGRGYDIVCATRYSKGGKKIGGEYLKTTLSRFAGLMTPLLLGIPTTDISNGFKIGEVPAIWRDRTRGKSKFKLLKWLPKYIRWYLYGILLRLNINRLVI